MTHLKSMLTAIVFTAVAVGFAFAMPAIVSTAARVPTQFEPVVTPSVLPTHTPTATVPPAEEDDNNEHPDNHGAVVSTAAHCPVKGRAHGELVRSIAQDKDATVADAEAACKAALAAAAAAPAKEKGKPEKVERVKPEHSQKPPKPVKAERTESGAPGNRKGHGKP